MTANNFIDAYNNFDGRPLEGDDLKDFYIDDVTQKAVENLNFTIERADSNTKMLLVGHRGCGKSTIINKVTENLPNKFHLVSFSASEELNLNDVEAIDILMVVYLQILDSIKTNRGIQILWDQFNLFMKKVTQKLTIQEVGAELLKILSVKIKVERNSRDIFRQEFNHEVDTLNEMISNCINMICQPDQNGNNQNKEVLIVIDDLDKLNPTIADRIFNRDYSILITPKAKILYTIPLETFYSPTFTLKFGDFETVFISLVKVINEKGENVITGINQLTNIISQRISVELMEQEALINIILHSGGLLRDLMKLMRDACKNASIANVETIDNQIAEEIIQRQKNDYIARFEDQEMELEYMRKILETKRKRNIPVEKLNFLLNFLFILEYRSPSEQLWYDVHPCLKDYINTQ